jgi:amino acid adenylation domain-containing protein
LKPARDLSRSAVFQVAFSLTASPSSGQEGVELPLSPYPVDLRATKFDLTLLFEQAGAEIRGHLEFNTDLFARPTIQRLISSFHHLLGGALRAPGTRVDRLPLMAPAERARVLSIANAPPRAYPRERSLPALFAERAAAQPDAVAVLTPSAAWSYAELAGFASALAGELRSRGIGTGVFVGVCMRRGAEMVGATLAILEAGAAYVPVDQELPAARVERMLSTVGARALITDADPPSPLLEASGLPPLLRVGSSLVPRSPAAPPFEPPVWRPEHSAYVIFTSGSTGEPKGVWVAHDPVLNLVDWVNRGFAVTESDRVLFTSSLGFDLSVYDIFGVLAAGGSIRVASEGELRDPRALRDILLDEPITLWNSAPAVFQQLVPFLDERDLAGTVPRLRLALLSGDWIPVALPDEIRAAFPRCEVIALGGATEATVWSNLYRVGVIDSSWPSIPYGQAAQNATYTVVDPELQPCAVGVPGELLIGGTCLAIGYFGAPRLTAERFVPDPFSVLPGRRVYRTGDLARLLPDGNLQFLGRLDQQVKLRGYRIELGEVEQALMLHPGVSAAVALAPGERLDRRLVAHVVPGSGKTLDPGELRTFLSRHLPGYMVPSAIGSLEAMPLTPNGKIDRGALAKLDLDESRRQTGNDPPRTAVEERLCQVWAEVLGRQDVGRSDDFFELGGHSLLNARIAARVREVFHVDLPMRAIFEAPLLRDQALRIEDLLAGSDTRARGGERRTPCLLLERLDSGTAAQDLSGPSRIPGALDVDALERGLGDLLREAGVAVTADVLDLSGLADPQAALRRVLARDAQLPSEPPRANGVRMRILRLGAREHLLLPFSASGSDAASAIAAGHLAACYEARLGGRETFFL